jgi:hypothetical protein
MLNLNVRREPALLWAGLIAPLAMALTAFFWTDNPAVQGAVNAAAVAVAAAITAWLVAAEDLVPLVLGAIEALIALGVAFGLGWTAEQQAAVMVPVGVIASILMRDRVVAPAPPIAT